MSKSRKLKSALFKELCSDYQRVKREIETNILFSALPSCLRTGGRGKGVMGVRVGS